MGVPVEQFFLFLGETDSESATSRLRADGAVYYKKLLESKLANWQQILNLLRAPTLQGVLATFTGNDYERMLRPEYETVSPEVLDAIAAVPHVVFVHEEVFFSDEERPSVQGDPDDHPGHEKYAPYGFMPPKEFFGLSCHNCG
jgi:hypothetical protein